MANPPAKTQILNLLKDFQRQYPGKTVSMRDLSKTLGVTKAYANALYNQLKKDHNLPPANLGKRGFGSMDRKKLLLITSKAGKIAHEMGRAHTFTSEEASRAGKIGGQKRIGITNLQNKGPDMLPKIRSFEEDLAPTLGGLFETAGFMKIEQSVQKQLMKAGYIVLTPLVTPIIGYSDSNEKKVLFLKSLFGGGIHKEETENSWRWYLKSRKTLPLLRLIQTYSPSWKTCIQSIFEWSTAETPTEKRIIAEELKELGSPPKDKVTKEDYQKLVAMPLFIAGVFEARGVLYKVIRPDNKLNKPVMYINSQNLQLLEAIKERYGGGIIKAKNSKALTLTIGKHTGEKIIHLLKPYCFKYN